VWTVFPATEIVDVLSTFKLDPLLMLTVELLM
jgi:hypothetical protein